MKQFPRRSPTVVRLPVLPDDPSPLPLVVVPATSPQKTPLTPLRVPLLWGTLLLLFMSLLVVSPIDPLSPLSSWGTFHAVAVLPLSSPLPTDGGQPCTLPLRPCVGGVHAFLCAALPWAEYAQQVMQEGDHPTSAPWYVSVILAQWAVEQGWHLPGYTGYNFGNVSAIPGEPTIGGTGQVGSPGAFAYAVNARKGVEYYVRFVKLANYRHVAEAWAAGPYAQAIALGQSPWDYAHYTNTGHPGSALVAVMDRFHLTHFDEPGVSC